MQPHIPDLGDELPPTLRHFGGNKILHRYFPLPRNKQNLALR
jgi:hypothetical protein